jgi:hypothetical protein
MSKSIPTPREDAQNKLAKLAVKLGKAAKAGDAEKSGKLADAAKLGRDLLKGQKGK